MFYRIFLALCEEKDVNRTTACLEIGLSKSAWLRWSNGQMPSGKTLQKLSAYFEVSPDFLLGLTREAQILGTKHELSELKRVYHPEADNGKQQEIAKAIADLQRSLDDLESCLPKPATSDPTPKDAAPKGGAGDATESADRFIRLYRQAPPWLQDQVLALLKAAESQHEAADADSKDQPAP